MRISAVIITFNEQDNIARCLNSLHEVADEIIVVDSFSNDNTREIAESFDKVRFFSNEWLGYAEQKNFGNALASHDVILSIDADECLSDELSRNIKKLKEEEYDSRKVYSLSRLTNYCGSWIKHCGWYPDIKTRIFDRRKVRWQGEFVHERLELPEGTETIRLKGDLLHYSYNDTSSHVKQIENFTNLTAKQALKDGKRISVLGLWFRPKWKFFRDYVIKGGFMDGYAGYQVCKLSAMATFLKYAKLREQRTKNLSDKQD